MEFFRITRVIPFMKHALVFNVVSLITFLLAVGFLAVRGLNLGVDFRGGTVIEIAYPHAADVSRVRSVIDKMNVGEFAVQSFGSANSALVRLPLKEGLSTAQLSERVLTALKADDPAVTQPARGIRRPAGRQGTLRERALALLLVCIGIVAYLALRLNGASRCRPSQPTCTMWSSFWVFRDVPVGILAAGAGCGARGSGLLRTNRSSLPTDPRKSRKMRKASVPEVINSAITSTLSRTIITHGCTLMMVLSILFWARRCTILRWRWPSASASVSILRRW
jgi:preprotein translocase subunit SecF